MDIINKEMEDNSMEDGAMASSSTTPMHTSARLAAKLKKLMQTDTTPITPMEVPMEIDAEEQKKQVHAMTLLASMTQVPATNKYKMNPDTKKICNNETPPSYHNNKDMQKIPEETEMETEDTTNTATKKQRTS